MQQIEALRHSAEALEEKAAGQSDAESREPLLALAALYRRWAAQIYDSWRGECSAVRDSATVSGAAATDAP